MNITKKPTKTDAERWLNDQPIDKIPEALVGLLKDHRTRRNGSTIRELHRNEFDNWFTSKFLNGILT